ncbi:DMT family transporter [Aminobacter sp. NyZ550]|uniref:DMT family transporter n=1 Tax=Aminobacter sp. NyZ550 TaxID=2979870 RepID=UPI0021D58C20|nr:DMT family transporter [Aminobacter sp. NyZ550]WAX96461.1 DMT family transporter [Aminobacter sp. NyZ550]
MYRNAYVLLLATTLFWGGNAVAGKLAVGHASPMLLTSLRWAFAAAFLGAVGWSRLRVDWAVARRQLWLLVALGGLGFTAFNAALYSALNFTSAINASIEQAGMPMVIFAANFILFRMRVSWGQILGFLLSLTGIALTASHGDLRSLLALDMNFGDALMLIAVLVYSAYTVALRFKPDIHWLSLMIVMTSAAFVTSLPFVAWEIGTGRAIAPDATGWAITAYMVLFPSILAQIFYIRGVELIGANRAGLFINMVPIFGTLLSVMIIGEDFQLYHAVAIVLVLGGIWLAEHSGRKMASAEELLAAEKHSSDA